MSDQPKTRKLASEEEAMRVAEEAREESWEKASFLKEMFLGKFRFDLVSPFPTLKGLDSPEYKAFYAKMKKFLKEEVDSDKIDREDKVPDDVIRKLAEMGAFGIKIKKEYGGLGFSMAAYTNIMKLVTSKDGALTALLSAHQSIGVPQPLILFGTEEQKKKYLTQIGSGKRLAAFAVTEPGAGSDITNLSTTATRDGEYYVLNGTKQWITNGGEAEIYSVFAMTNKSKGPRGCTGFIVEKGMEGFSFGKKEKKLGIRASATRELIFDNCRVPKENVIGREGLGFFVILKTFDHSRPGIGAQGVGLAQGALDYAVQYTRERSQFGRHISSFQVIQHMLADMAIQIEAARALVYAVARHIDSKPREISQYAAMAKTFASDMAMRVTTDAIQVLGGYGYMRDYPLEKMMRDAKILQIYEGTNQIQRNEIAAALIKEAARKRKKR